MLPNETRQRVFNLPQNILPSGHALKHIALDETPQLTPFHFREVLALPTDQAPHLISKPKVTLKLISFFGSLAIAYGHR